MKVSFEAIFRRFQAGFQFQGRLNIQTPQNFTEAKFGLFLGISGFHHRITGGHGGGSFRQA